METYAIYPMQKFKLEITHSPEPERNTEVCFFCATTPHSYRTDSFQDNENEISQADLLSEYQIN